MEINGLTVTAASEQQFIKSLEVYPCSYHPAVNLEACNNPDGSQCVILPLAAKRLWFFTYCKEAGKLGKIIPECGEVKFNIGSTDGGSVGFVTAKASIFMDDVFIAAGEAGQAFICTNLGDMGNLVQSVTGLAQSRALTNAGFGTVDRLDVICPGNSTGDPTGTPSGNGGNSGNPLPFTYPGSAGTNEPAAPAPSTQQFTGMPGVNTATQQTFEMLGGMIDELTMAKRTPYPMRGQYAGKPLGELPTNALEFLVKYNSARASQDILTAQAAARAILQDRQKASGKAIP